jgi:hypothetical protein
MIPNFDKSIKVKRKEKWSNQINQPLLTKIEKTVVYARHKIKYKKSIFLFISYPESSTEGESFWP